MTMLRNLVKRMKNQKGVTLIELLAVIIILGIIAAIGVPAIMNSKKDAENSKGSSNAAIITQAAKRHIFNEETYSGATAPATNQYDLGSMLSELNISTTGGTVTEGTQGTSSDPNPNETATFADDTGTYTLQVNTGICTFAHK